MKLYLIWVISMSLCMMYGNDLVRTIATIITGIGALIVAFRWNILFPPPIDPDQLLEDMLATPPDPN